MKRKMNSDSLLNYLHLPSRAIQGSSTMEHLSSGLKSPTDKSLADLKLPHTYVNILLTWNQLHFMLAYINKKAFLSLTTFLEEHLTSSWSSETKQAVLYCPRSQYLSLKKEHKDNVTAHKHSSGASRDFV